MEPGRSSGGGGRLDWRRSTGRSKPGGKAPAPEESAKGEDAAGVAPCCGVWGRTGSAFDRSSAGCRPLAGAVAHSTGVDEAGDGLAPVRATIEPAAPKPLPSRARSALASARLMKPRVVPAGTGDASAGAVSEMARSPAGAIPPEGFWSERMINFLNENIWIISATMVTIAATPDIPISEPPWRAQTEHSS